MAFEGEGIVSLNGHDIEADKARQGVGLSRFRTWWLPVCDSGKSSATSYGNSPCWRSPGTNPCACSFTALVASIGARGFCALGSLSLTSTPHWKPCSCYFRKDQRCVLGAIDPMSWKRCGTWKVCARNGRETSAQHTETSLCRGSSVEGRNCDIIASTTGSATAGKGDVTLIRVYFTCATIDAQLERTSHLS